MARRLCAAGRRRPLADRSGGLPKELPPKGQEATATRGDVAALASILGGAITLCDHDQIPLSDSTKRARRRGAPESKRRSEYVPHRQLQFAPTTECAARECEQDRLSPGMPSQTSKVVACVA